MLGVSPVEMNGMVSRTQDFSAIKQHDDAKPVIDQGNSQVQVEKNAEHKASTVQEGQRTETDSENAGGGLGSYFGDGGQKRKKKEQPKERVVVKHPGGGFNLTV